jgi:hypothetical protein
MAKSQRKDTADSMRIAERMADAAEVSAEANRESQRSAARDRRIALEREVSVSAHRLAVQAKLVQNLVTELRSTIASNFIFAGQSTSTSSRAKMFDAAQEERAQRITWVSDSANKISGEALRDKSEDDLIESLKSVDSLAAEIEALKEQVLDELGSARAYLERQQARRESAMDQLNRPPG